MALFYDEYFEDRDRLGIRVLRTLFRGQSPYQLIEILETVQFGRVLVIDGVFMTSEWDETFYHEPLVHPAMLAHRSPRRVLVIGGGDGGTVREVLRHPAVEACVMVEIDAMVIDACKEHLSSIGTAWNDPRLDVRVGDGVAFVRETDEAPFDVVILDGTDPVGPGEALFDEGFYAAVRGRMAPGGVLSLQSESPVYTPEVFQRVQRQLGSVFEHVVPLFGPVPLYGVGLWSYTLASDREAPLTDGDMERLSALEPELRYLNREMVRAVFAQPAFVRRLTS